MTKEISKAKLINILSAIQKKNCEARKNQFFGPCHDCIYRGYNDDGSRSCIFDELDYAMSFDEFTSLAYEEKKEKEK